MANPSVGMKVRLRVPVGNPGDPGRLEPGTEGVIDEVVTAETLGSDRDEIAVRFEIEGQGTRRVGFAVQGNVTAEELAAGAVDDEHALRLLNPRAHDLSWTENFEVIG